MDLVPGDANMVVELDWHTVVHHPMLRELAVRPRWFADLEAAGISTDAVESLLLFSQSLGSEKADETAILTARGLGRRTQDTLKGRGWAAEVVNARRLYTFPGPADRTAARLTNNVIVTGPAVSVRRVLKGDGGFVARPEVTTVAHLLREETPVRLVIAWPSDLTDASRVGLAVSASLLKLAGVGPLTSIIERLGIGRAFVLRLNPETDGIRVKLDGALADEATASAVAGSISLLKGLASFVPSRTPDHSSPLASLTVARAGTVVSLGMVVARPQPEPAR